MSRGSIRSSGGLTILEVLITIVMLAAGILVIAQFQTSSLRNTGLAAAMNQTTRLVRGELEWQRQTAVTPDQTDCTLEELPVGFDECVIEILPCAYVFEDGGPGGELVCDLESSPVTYQITVTASGPRGQVLSLRTLYTGLFVAGSAGAPPDQLVTGEE